MENNFLESTLYPTLFATLDTALPEFGFKSKDTGAGKIWTSTTRRRPDMHEGSEPGKTYVTETAPYYLADFAGRGRSVWDYVATRDSLTDNREVFAKLCALACVKRDTSPEQAAALAAAARRAEILEAANWYLIEQLHTTTAAAAARDYLKARPAIVGILRRPDEKASDAIGRERAEIGFLPSVPALVSCLRDVFGPDCELPPLPPGNAGGRISITMRERGQIVGFKFRAIDAHTEPKYLNSTGYEKAAHLVGLRRKQANGVVLVEGELDVIAAHGAGFLDVVSTGGAALSPAQLKKAAATGGPVTIAFDNDEPGKKATHKAVLSILEYQRETGQDFPVFVASYPDGNKDFEGMLNNANGQELARQMLDNRAGLGTYFYKWLSNEKSAEILKETGGDHTTDLFRAALLEAAAQVEILLPLADLPQFRAKMAPTFEAYAIDITGMQAAAAAARDTLSKKRYGKELQRIATKAAAAAAQGEHGEAERLLKHEIPAARAKLHAGRFAELLQGHNRESIADGLAGEGIRTRYQIARNGKSIALELPAAAVSVFAAASGHGKTAMLINLALDVCEQYPAKEVHFFTLEESREAVAAKMLNTFSNTQFADSNESAIFAALRGDFSKMSESTKAEFRVKTAQFFDLYGKRLFVHYVETATVEELTEAVRYLNERRPVAAIFCDYVQLLGVENRGRLDRIEELKRVCLALKETANATRLPLVFAAQFNRTVRSEADSHQYTNIGEAGDIERIAALIVGLWNRTFSAEDAKPEPANIMAAKVLKWRGGPVGYTGAWAWDGNRKTIENETVNPAKNTSFNISKS